MTASRTPMAALRARRQAGFTLLEMMVALTISLVVMLGFAATFVSMKTTFNSQSSLSQLQDNERLAMTVLTASVGQAGYFPTGANILVTPRVAPQMMDRTAFSWSSDSVGGQMPTGTYLYGTAAGTNAESFQTGYMTSSGDGLLTCQGGTNTSGGALLIRNVFYVQNGALGCSVLVGTAGSTTTAPGGTFVPLISGVQSMTVLYGVAGSGSQIDRYRAVGSMAAADWGNVKNVRISLQFANPNDSTKPFTWVQNINVMNNKTL